MKRMLILQESQRSAWLTVTIIWSLRRRFQSLEVWREYDDQTDDRIICMDLRFWKNKFDQLCNQEDPDHDPDSERYQNFTLRQNTIYIKSGDPCILCDHRSDHRIADRNFVKDRLECVLCCDIADRSGDICGRMVCGIKIRRRMIL